MNYIGRITGDNSLIIIPPSTNVTENEFEIQLNFPSSVVDSRKPSAIYANIKNNDGVSLGSVVLRKEENYYSKVTGYKYSDIQLNFVCDGCTFSNINSSNGVVIADVEIPTTGDPINTTISFIDINKNKHNSYKCKYGFYIEYRGGTSSLITRFSPGEEIFSGPICLGYSTVSNGTILCSSDYGVNEGSLTTVKQTSLMTGIIIQINTTFASMNGCINGTYTLLNSTGVLPCYVDVYNYPEVAENKWNGYIASNLVKTISVQGVFNSSTKKTQYDISINELDDSKRYLIIIRQSGFFLGRTYIENAKFTFSASLGDVSRFPLSYIFPTDSDDSITISSTVRNGTSSTAPIFSKQLDYTISCNFKNDDGSPCQEPVSLSILQGSKTTYNFNPMYSYSITFSAPSNSSKFHRNSSVFVNGSSHAKLEFLYY